MLYLGSHVPCSQCVDKVVTTLCTLGATAAAPASFCSEMPANTVISSASGQTGTNRALSLIPSLDRAFVDVKSATSKPLLLAVFS